jgi:DNA mismatch repair protein MLH1
MLTSIRNLLHEIDQQTHEGLGEVFRHHTWVGLVNADLALIQHRTKLYLCQVRPLSKALMYQTVLRKFSRLAPLRFAKPVPIPVLLQLALDCPDSGWTEEDGPKEDIVKYIVAILLNRADMLKEYFAMELDAEANLLTLPLIIDNYVPNMENLPRFALDLGACNWSEEQPCFFSIAKALARFYAVSRPEGLDSPSTSASSTSSSSSSSSNGGIASFDSTSTASACSAESMGGDWMSYEKKMEHVIFRAMRHLQPARRLTNNGAVVQIACLENLYKIFERC